VGSGRRAERAKKRNQKHLEVIRDAMIRFNYETKIEGPVHPSLVVNSRIQLQML